MIRSETIQHCKDVIAERAASMALKFDVADIIVVNCGNGNDCVFLKQYFWMPEVDIDGNFILDENGDPVMIKLPNIWAEYPPMPLAKSRAELIDSKWITTIEMPLPKISIIMPQLVFLVHADNTVKDGGMIGDSICFDLVGHE